MLYYSFLCCHFFVGTPYTNAKFIIDCACKEDVTIDIARVNRLMSVLAVCVRTQGRYSISGIDWISTPMSNLGLMVIQLNYDDVTDTLTGLIRNQDQVPGCTNVYLGRVNGEACHSGSRYLACR